MVKLSSLLEFEYGDLYLGKSCTQTFTNTGRASADAYYWPSEFVVIAVIGHELVSQARPANDVELPNALYA